MKFSAGNIFTTVGGVVAIFGVVAMEIGLKFSVPPEVLTVVVYKGIFAAGGGLLIVGAILGRLANRKRQAAELDRNEGRELPGYLPGGNTDSAGDIERQRTGERITREGR